MSAVLHLNVDEDLLVFVPTRRRRPDLRVTYDGTSSLGHVIQSVGIPLPEVGSLTIGPDSVDAAHRPASADIVDVAAVARPVRLPANARFLLDVHLGSLARRLRLLGLDTRYDRQLDDDAMTKASVDEKRILLTKDRGLLQRTVLRPRSAYVRGDGAEQQLRDVLDRFAPTLKPFSRCLVCNGKLNVVSKNDVAATLEPGTARSYDDYSQCANCGQVYWRGAHANRLAEVVAQAEQHLRSLSGR